MLQTIYLCVGWGAGWWSTLKLCLLLVGGGGGEVGEEGAVLEEDVAGVEDEEDEDGDVNVVELEESDPPKVTRGVVWAWNKFYNYTLVL